MDIVFNVWYSLRTIFIFYFVVTNLLFGLFMYKSGYYRWYLSCVPFVNLFTKHDSAGCNIILLLLQGYYTFALFYYGPTILTLMILVVCKCVNDYQFSATYINGNSLVYTLVPFAKYIYMLKETLGCVNTTKVKSMKNSLKATKSS